VGTAIPASAQELRQSVADALGIDVAEVHDGEDLVELGLDSVTAMSLVGRWRRAGLDATAAEFIERPTIEAWWACIARAATPRHGE
jgi:aryl carrier-like protein